MPISVEQLIEMRREAKKGGRIIRFLRMAEGPDHTATEIGQTRLSENALEIAFLGRLLRMAGKKKETNIS